MTGAGLEMAWESKERNRSCSVMLSPTNVTLFIISTVSLGAFRLGAYGHPDYCGEDLERRECVCHLVPFCPLQALQDFGSGHGAVPVSKAGSAQEDGGRIGKSAMKGPHDPPIMQPQAKQGI